MAEMQSEFKAEESAVRLQEQQKEKWVLKKPWTESEREGGKTTETFIRSLLDYKKPSLQSDYDTLDLMQEHSVSLS